MSDEIETIDKNPKSWAAWKREAERLQAIIDDMALAAMDSEPVQNHIGSKNSLDAIVSFIKSKSNPTVKCYEEVSEQLFKDNCHGIHSHVIEYILKLGEELDDLRAEQDEIQSAPVSTTETISFDEWSRKCALQITLCYPDFREKAKYIWDSARETQQLAPAPVVSADLLHTAASAIEDLLTTKDRTGAGVWFDLPFRLRSAANAQPAPAAPVCTCPSGDGSLRWPCPVHPGNSPVIPDGYRLQPISEYEAMCATVNSDEWPQRWIPVSERMPEDRTQVILWDAEIGEVTSGHYSHKTHTFYHCGYAIENEITHWMPLPAAPQEVKGE